MSGVCASGVCVRVGVGARVSASLTALAGAPSSAAKEAGKEEEVWAAEVGAVRWGMRSGWGVGGVEWWLVR